MARRRVRSKRGGARQKPEAPANAPTRSQGRRFVITIALVFAVVVLVFIALEYLAP